MKITIYELLGMVKDGKVPKKIKYNTFELKKTMSNELLRMYVDEDGMFFPEYYSSLNLNDKVEILEEEKKIPEKLDVLVEIMSSDKIGALTNEIGEIQRRFNQLIDYLKSKGDE